MNGMVKIRSCNSRAYSKNNSRRLDILVNEVPSYRPDSTQSLPS